MISASRVRIERWIRLSAPKRRPRLVEHPPGDGHPLLPALLDHAAKESLLALEVAVERARGEPRVPRDAGHVGAAVAEALEVAPGRTEDAGSRGGVLDARNVLHEVRD
jgi:hypothetical protein